MKNMNLRAFGILVTLLASGLSYWAWVSILDKAAKSEERISLPYNFAMIVSCVSFGVALMIFGDKIKTWSDRMKSEGQKPIDFVFIGIFVIPGFVAFLVLKNKLQSMGYNF